MKEAIITIIWQGKQDIKETIIRHESWYKSMAKFDERKHTSENVRSGVIIQERWKEQYPSILGKAPDF